MSVVNHQSGDRKSASVAEDAAALRWLVRRSLVLWAALLAIVGTPLMVLMTIPSGYFRSHAAVHAVWSTIVIAVVGVVSLRAAVRRSRLPSEVVGLVMFLGACTYAVVWLIVVPGGYSKIQSAFFVVVFAAFSAANLRALSKAWRSGWRPPIPEQTKGEEGQGGGA